MTADSTKPETPYQTAHRLAKEHGTPEAIRLARADLPEDVGRRVVGFIEYLDRNRDVHGALPETAAEKEARWADRRARGRCQRSRYCDRPLAKDNARYCPECAALMADVFEDIARDAPPEQRMPEDLESCPVSADAFDAYHR